MFAISDETELTFAVSVVLGVVAAGKDGEKYVEVGVVGFDSGESVRHFSGAQPRFPRGGKMPLSVGAAAAGDNVVDLFMEKLKTFEHLYNVPRESFRNIILNVGDWIEN